jgi:hypothetical protein
MPDSQCWDMSRLSRGLVHDPYPFSSYDTEKPRLTKGEVGMDRKVQFAAWGPLKRMKVIASLTNMLQWISLLLQIC